MDRAFATCTIVGVDPPANDGKPKEDDDDLAEAGIVTSCSFDEGVVKGCGDGPTYLVIDDASGMCTPNEWGLRSIKQYRHWRADRIVAEKNQGGEMVRSVIHAIDPNVPVELVHAYKGKRARAEPVASLYEQRRVGHARSFSVLEDQMATFTGAKGEKSPDRHDGLVYSFHGLFEGAVIVAGIPEVDSVNAWHM